MGKFKTRFMARTLVAVLFLFTISSVSFLMHSCTPISTTGKPTLPDLASIDEVLTKHQSLIKLGVEASVLTGLKADPSREAIVTAVATWMMQVSVSNTASIPLRDYLTEALRLPQFTATQKLFIDALLDEFVITLEDRRMAYCVNHASDPVCSVQNTWLQTTEIYLRTFGYWLQEAVSLYQQETRK